MMKRLKLRNFLRVLSALAMACVLVTAPDASAAKKKKAKAVATKPAKADKKADKKAAEPTKPAEPAKPVEPAKAPEPKKVEAAPAAKLDVTDLWLAKCKGCHGAEGKGKPDKTADMTTPAWQKQFTDAQIRKAITAGFEREKDGKAQKMKAFPDLTPAQLDGLVAHIRALK